MVEKIKEPPGKKDCFDAIIIHQKEKQTREGQEKKSLASLFFFGENLFLDSLNVL